MPRGQDGGLFCQGSVTGGRWSEVEISLHINELGLLAAFFTLKAFLKHVRSIFLLSDNVTTVAYINHLGGTKSCTLVEIAKELWTWCFQRGIALQAQHLPGKPNLHADFMSRHLRDRTDWILNPALFKFIKQLWGPLEIDLFATRFSHQLPRFFSWRPDPETEATDAFSQDWRNLRAYAHPPWCLIARVLAKALATLVLITPCWPTQAWFPQLIQMVADFPLVLPDPLKTQVVIASPNCNCPVLIRPPQLVAWKVSGSSSKRNLLQKELLALFSLHGETRQIPHTILHGVNGNVGVLPTIPIPFRQILPTYSSS